MNIFNEKILPQAVKMLKKAKIPGSAKVAETWKTAYFNELKNRRYGYDEKGNVICLDDNGNVLTNAHGWPMSGTEAIEQSLDNYFERNNYPETEAEYLKRLRNPKITPE